MKNLLITKSSDFKSVLLSGQTTKPYSKTGKHLLLYIIRTVRSLWKSYGADAAFHLLYFTSWENMLLKWSVRPRVRAF